MFAVLALIVIASAMGQKTGADAPTLPTQWTAETIEPGAPGGGDGIEAYNFNPVPTYDYPSALWSNYTDCERLIMVNNNYDQKRYLLGCDSLDCCWEPQNGNQVEFQIPNIHYSNPNKKVEVTYERANITNFQEQVEVDLWQWTWTMGSWKVATNDCADCVNGVELIQWSVKTEGIWYDIQFKGFKGLDPETDEGKAFTSSFQVPAICSANNLLQCSEVSTKKRESIMDKINIVPSGFVEDWELPKPTPGKLSYRKPLTDSCNGPHEACCEAPMRDPNNCPDSARTSDCDKQKACCCA